MHKNIQRQILVSGQVQGVFFRQSCMQLARQLKLTGGVRNLRDGRVEVQVSGVAEAVEALIKWLEIGPKHAKVSIIEVIDLDISDIATNNLPINNLTDVAAGQFVIWPTC